MIYIIASLIIRVISSLLALGTRSVWEGRASESVRNRPPHSQAAERYIDQHSSFRFARFFCMSTLLPRVSWPPSSTTVVASLAACALVARWHLWRQEVALRREAERRAAREAQRAAHEALRAAPAKALRHHAERRAAEAENEARLHRYAIWSREPSALLEPST